MSDEEIISLNRMKLFARSSDLSIVSAKDMNIVVNLVEKQSKEIEELKKDREKYIIRLTDKQYKTAMKLFENDINKSWEDKIKAKIEKRQKRIEQLHPGSDCVIIDDLENEIEVLQSLLEKE